MPEKVIYAGSFDPLHVGHLFVIESAINLFDEVYLVLVKNDEKRYNNFIPFDERVKIITRVMKREYPSVKVILLENAFIADFARDNGINYLIRGLRNSDDFNQEKLMSRVNSKIGNDLQTVFVMSPVEIDTYSSNLIRGFVGLINWEDKIKSMVPPEIYEYILFNYNGGKHSFIKSLRSCIKGGDGSSLISDKLNNSISIFFDKVFLRYTDKLTRSYHNLNHVFYMLKELDSISTSKLSEKDGIDLNDMDYDILKLAIWGHDFIYDTSSNNNEEDSADLFKSELLKLGMDKKIVDRIHSMIISTKHDSEVKDPLSKILCDLDFSKGGKSNIEGWLTSAHEIRKEYEQFSDEEWMNGRMKFLKKTLENERIYHTNYFYDLYESSLRHNMTIELKNIREYTEEDWEKKESFD